MNADTRLGRVMERLATGTNALRARSYDSERSARNGNGRDGELERAVEKFEKAADELWSALGIR